MKNFYCIESFDKKKKMLELNVLPGSDVMSSTREALEISKNLGCLVYFKFNDVPILVSKYTDTNATYDWYIKNLRQIEE